MEKLIGKEVKEIKINYDKDLIKLVCVDSVLFLSAYGDCCSRSWFEHMTGVDALIGQKINKVVEREMPPAKENEEEMECLQFYGWTIETNRGRCDLEMRNESNGYYGGDCEVDEKPLGKYGGTRDDDATKTVTDDF